MKSDCKRIYKQYIENEWEYLNNATILEVSCQKQDILDKPVSYYSECKIMELGNNIIDIDRVENCIKSAYTTVINQYNQYYREYKNNQHTQL